MNSSQLQNADSGNVEWYTPAFIVDAARNTMGGIDFDPFSNEIANTRVNAWRYFTQENDGLKQDWFGRVWMNHPYGREMNHACIEKLIMEFAIGNIQSACCITFANTSEKWFQHLLRFPQCFLSPRTQYIDGKTGNPVKGVTKGSVVTYLGDDLPSFREHFKKLGVVKV
jgi:hypothetical protein